MARVVRLLGVFLAAWPALVWAQPASQPVSFSLSEFLLNHPPGSVVEPLDFGGLSSTRLALVSQQGVSWTATRYRLQGMDATDPYQPGRPLVFPDLEALQEPVVRSGEIALFPREAGPRWHAELSSWNTASLLAASNLPPPGQRGTLLGADQFHWFTRNRLQLGGPLGKRADLLVSGAGQWASQTIPEEPREDLKTRLQFGNARARVSPSARDRLEVYITGSRIDRSGWSLPAGLEALTGRRMAPPLRPVPQLKEEDHLDFVQTGWTRQFPGSSLLESLELRHGYSTGHLDTQSKGNLTAPFSLIELTSGMVEGLPPLCNFAIRTRHSLAAVFRTGNVRLGSQTHQITLTSGWQTAAARNRFLAPPALHLITAEGVPAFLVELNTPLDSRTRVRSVSFGLEDRITLTSWLSLDLGVLADLARGALPAQSGTSGREVIAWNHASPRAGLALRAPGFPGLVLRGSFSRTYQALAGRYLDFANPNSLGGLEYRWQPPDRKGELLRRFGGPYSSLSGALQRPYADQFTVAAEVTAPRRSFVRLELFRRDEKDRIAAVNTGVPFEAYRPRLIADPGPDFIPGTFDDQRLWVFEQDPSSFGKDQFLLTNPGLRMLNSGLLAEAGSGETSLEWRASFAAMKSFGPTNPGNQAWENDSGVVGSLFHDPNTLINATGRSFFDRAYAGKLHIGWRMPRSMGGLRISSVVNYLDGLAFGRRLLVKDLAQGPFLVAATPRGSPAGGHRTQYLLDWDLRLSRDFDLRLGRIRFAADVFNVLNRAGKLRENDLSGPSFNQRLPSAVQPPRFVRLGVLYQL